MSEIVMVIAPSIFRDEEYAVPKRIFEARGGNVTTASVSAGTCVGKLGMTAEATMSLADAVQRPWDAVVFVGGGGAEVLFDDPAAHELARKAVASGAVLGAICIAPSILARAGLLQAVHATAFPSQKDDLIAHGAIWTESPVVGTGRIVTANGPEAAQAFGDAIVAKLGI